MACSCDCDDLQMRCITLALLYACRSSRRVAAAAAPRVAATQTLRLQQGRSVLGAAAPGVPAGPAQAPKIWQLCCRPQPSTVLVWAKGIVIGSCIRFPSWWCVKLHLFSISLDQIPCWDVSGSSSGIGSGEVGAAAVKDIGASDCGRPLLGQFNMAQVQWEFAQPT